MELKLVMFLCRLCLSMYFSPKKFYVWSTEFFSVLSHEFIIFCPSRGNKNPYGSDTKTLCISIEKELFIKPYKCFWYKPSHSSSLVGCYNAIYVTLDKIQTRKSVHPHKPNHYVHDSFFLHFLSLCFRWKKVASWQFCIIFV